jgi:hypothetical protein
VDEVNPQQFRKAIAAAISGAVVGFVGHALNMNTENTAALSTVVSTFLVYLIPNEPPRKEPTL